VDLTLGAEEWQIVDSAAQFLAGAYPIARLHRAEGQDRADGTALAAMGWFAIALPERLGGLGMSVVDEALVFREIGRRLGPVSVLPTAIAAEVAARAGTDALAGTLIRGEASAALAVALPGQEGGFMLHGGRDATHAIRIEPDRATLHALQGASIDPRPALDKSIPLGRARLGQPMIVLEDGAPYRRAALALAAMQSGLAEAVMAMTVDYAKLRVTFGRPIGAYQAVRHPCADMALRAEAARALLLNAAVAVRDGLEGAAELVEAARAISHDAAIRNADDSIQLHGGVGITEEHDAHLFMKRAQTLGQWLGSKRAVLDRIAAMAVA